jgi:hypothetical protein
LIILRRKVKGGAKLTNADRWFFVQLYRWFQRVSVVIGAGNRGGTEGGRRFRRSCGL